MATAKVDLSNATIDADAVSLLDYSTCRRHKLMPLYVRDNVLYIAIADPNDTNATEQVRLETGLFAEPLYADEEQLTVYINNYYGHSRISNIASQFIVDENLKNMNLDMNKAVHADVQNAPAVRLIDSLIESAVLYNASDIHIEPYEDILRTRYRIDGQLKLFEQVDVSLLPNIISRIKIMANMDISEKRIPQDGHFVMTVNGRAVDFRISTMPTVFGEKAVIRLIYTSGTLIGKAEMGFLEHDMKRLSEIFAIPNGAILITGPTGSGKTTTLFSFLTDLNKEGVNIVTIEDPVEHRMKGVNQIQINPRAGLGFGSVLRSVLRQDPDIIMVGEIRDEETAHLAIRAAITGHLMLGTLHTNDAVSAIIRLINMGVEHYLVSSALKAVISQRLVRRLCKCKRPSEYAGEESYAAQALGIKPGERVYIPTGCSSCAYTGYMGRFAIYEYVVMDDGLKEIVDRRGTMGEIKAHLRAIGFKGMWDNARERVLRAETSLDEIMRLIDITEATGDIG